MKFNLTIQGKSGLVTQPLRDYVADKLSGPARHFDQLISVAVSVKVEKRGSKVRRQRASVKIHYKGRDIFIEETRSDLYQAINYVMERLDRLVVAYKTQVQDHRGQSPFCPKRQYQAAA